MNQNQSPNESTRVQSRGNALPSRFAGRALIAAALALFSPAYAASQAPGESATAASQQARKNQVILITGSTSGLGREVALRLAATGAHIIVHGRSRERGMEVVHEIEKKGIGSAKFYAADLASFAEVRAFAEAILRDYDRLDILINNAGIHLVPQDGRQVSADGHELTFAVNYLSGYLLTRLLLPRLIASAPSRIVNVSSAGQARAVIDFDDVMLKRNYDDSQAYRQSKLAQVMFTFDLARELAGTGVIVNALHPASMMDTPMVVSRLGQPQSSVEDGVKAVVNLITSPNLEGGQYFNSLTPERANDQAYDEAARAKLRKLSMELTGVGSH